MSTSSNFGVACARNCFIGKQKTAYSWDFKYWPVLLSPGFISRIRIVMVFDEDDSVLFTTTDKKVYGIGKNHDGRLGAGDRTSYYLPEEVETLTGKKIETLCCGRTVQSDYHVLHLQRKERYILGVAIEKIY